MTHFPQKRPQRAVVVTCLVLCIAPCSCRKAGVLPNQKQGKGDVSTFIFSQIPNFGGSNILPSRGTVSGITNYVYSEDNDGFQVVCLGNKVAVLCSMFQSQFGNAALSTTNASGLASFVYAVHQTGVAVNCGLDRGIIGGARQEVTQLVVVRAAALR